MPDGDIVHSRLRRLYQKPYKWLCEGTATSDESALDDVVDRTHEVEGLTSPEMRERLIRLYRTYILEWDTVEPQISADFLNQANDQKAPQDLQLAIQ